MELYLVCTKVVISYDPHNGFLDHNANTANYGENYIFTNLADAEKKQLELQLTLDDRLEYINIKNKSVVIQKIVEGIGFYTIDSQY